MLRGPVCSCVDLHASRALQLSASTLATYNHISKYSKDLIVKQLNVLVTAPKHDEPRMFDGALQGSQE